MAISIRRVGLPEALPFLPELVGLLQDSVDNGASVGFLPPLAAAEATHFWQQVLDAVQADHRILLLATDETQVLGSVQLDLVEKPNGRHRAEVMKLLVHSRARRQGLGRQLMQALEEQARQHQRSTLVLDTLQGEPSELLYQSLGYVAVGAIPRFARVGSGALEPTVIYYKLLEG
ncbi:GNAT family N-acetyltransferase [Microvirga sp. STR05]|uniref:GNAT family N-acetyltransferase n=1 Tax=Hymenobacter duratus TaxID=2771356 RepID=A0ABR8JEE8_9BACT|nr:GNAT family N-acetyltransferase [Hymenobacter duratus]MBD2713943.1 GNAT family N-acetyltransferase [Hymenobacter duratus]MBR7948845.1 GNAT family N-acetyltransferase [Microvirga sp. STR05]